MVSCCHVFNVQGVSSIWDFGRAKGAVVKAYFDISDGSEGFYVTPRLGANYF